jgi:hypothetical protein
MMGSFPFAAIALPVIRKGLPTQLRRSGHHLTLAGAEGVKALPQGRGRNGEASPRAFGFSGEVRSKDEALIQPQFYSAVVFAELLLRAKMRALPARHHRRQRDSGWRSARTAFAH